METNNKRNSDAKVAVMNLLGEQFDRMMEIKSLSTRRVYFVNFVICLLDAAQDIAYETILKKG